MKWHTTLRERCVRTGALEPIYDIKWGRFRPDRRFNDDQSRYHLLSIQPECTRLWSAVTKKTGTKTFGGLNQKVATVSGSVL